MSILAKKRPARSGSIVLGIALLAACSQAPAGPAVNTDTAGDGPVVVDLRVRTDDQSPYLATDQLTVPASHEIGDGMFPYEGIGWENGLVGYRLYLDGRLVSDIFGKRKADPALVSIGQHGSYHDLADWGMDVLKVGPSLGIGGLGIIRGGEPVQFGEVANLSASIEENSAELGRFTVKAGGIATDGGGSGDIVARYSIASGSPLTRVNVTSKGLPLASGIVMHDGAEFWQSGESDTSGWAYIATYGQQSENKDMLGMALFYRTEQANYGGLANSTHFVTFDTPEFDYAFLAAWELDPMGIKDRAAFDSLLQKERQRLEETR